MALTRIGRIKQFCLKRGVSVDFYIEMVASNMKWCFKCESWIHIDQFNTDNSRWDKRASKCIFCRRVKQRKSWKGRPSVFKGKSHKPETIELLKRKNSGCNNPNWKGGTTVLIGQIRNSSQYKEWRLAVYKKGNYTCSECLTKKSNKNIILDADHIVPISKIIVMNNITTIEEALCCGLLFDVKNGRCLCRTCHKKTSTWGVNKYNYGSI